MGFAAVLSPAFMADFLSQSGGYAVIDGGLATELEGHGADLNDPLWSAKCLVHSPNLIRRVIQTLSLSLSPHFPFLKTVMKNKRGKTCLIFLLFFENDFFFL